MLFMSVDGGGTKILAVLFDESFRLIASGRGGGVNANVVGTAAAEISMRDCIESCLSGVEKPVLIGRLSLAMCGDKDRFLSILREHADVREVEFLSEGHMGLLAGLRKPHGALAQAGTGSFAFVREPDGQERSLGGYGWILGDEGSGGWIGRQGIAAAFRARDGLDKPSIISDLLAASWGFDHLRQAVDLVYGSPQPVMKAASACPVVCQAARQGDAVAIGICCEAGLLLARQLLALLHKYTADDVTVAGSAWKGNPHMVETFRREMQAVRPGVAVTRLAFEPVMGGVFSTAIHLGIMPDEGFLQEQFHPYIIPNNT